MDWEADIEAIQRSLREITHVRDAATSKTLKAVLERQLKFVRKLSELEAVVRRMQGTAHPDERRRE